VVQDARATGLRVSALLTPSANVVAGSTSAARRAGIHVAAAAASSTGAITIPISHGFIFGATTTPCVSPILTAAMLSGDPARVQGGAAQEGHGLCHDPKGHVRIRRSAPGSPTSAHGMPQLRIGVAPQVRESTIEVGRLTLITCLGVETAELAVRHREKP
jgi:hypothetical protein